MTQYQCVGVDVAKDKFDAVFYLNSQSKHRQFSNNKKGYHQFRLWLKKLPLPAWICMEATGHYSELIADYLYEQNIRVSIVNPLQIKNFSRMKLARNKNDYIDAQIIADYCEIMQPRSFTPRSASQKELKDLTKVLDTLKAQLTQLKNQLYSTQGKLAKKAIEKLIKQLEKDIQRVEKQLGALVESHAELNEKMTLITSIKGVGELTAYKVLAQVNDIHCFGSAKQFAAFVGVSPKQNESGKFKGKTTISRIGDSRLRKALYMAALVAKRYNPTLRPFVKRLESRGKAPKAIVCAVMRKLTHWIYGVLKSKTPFHANFA